MSVNYEEEILDGGYRKINLTGTLDAPSTMAIEEKFQALIKTQDKDVIVDLSGIDYVSSYGMRMLMVGARNLKTSGATLRLAAASDHVREIIKLVGYDLAFPVYDTLEDAVAVLGS